MLAIRRILFLLPGLLLVMAGVMAQADSSRKLKIAVFAPVYLDSAFTDNGNYKLGTNNLPRYMLPGLDFYNGVMLAVDSLNRESASIEVLFYDIRSISSPLYKTLEDTALEGLSLIIASFNTRSDIRPLADFALKKRVPMISSTYPNDGGLTRNPYFVLINPTLRTHCEALYKYLQRIYPTSSMVMYRRKGIVEDMIQSAFGEMGRNTPGIPLQIKTVELADSFTTSQVISYLDSSKENIVICGTLNENFGANLVKSLSESKKIKTIAIGMPTWDALKEIDKNIEVVYTTPYHYPRKDILGLELTSRYRAKYFGRPSDMVFKGFEAMYHFSKLLLKHDSLLIKNLSDKDFSVFNEFDIRPVRVNKDSATTDYLENKKLYFIRKMDGQIKSVN